MSQDDPLMSLVVAGLAGYLFWLWLGDYRRGRSGVSDPQALPGATSCPPTAIGIAVIGALVLLAVETVGEYALGISGEQTNIKVLFLLPMVAAAFGEELIFRGFLVVTKRGPMALVASIIGFSLLFSLAHPFLWDWKEAQPGAGKSLVFDFSLKAWWSTGMVLVFSLWMYAARFLRLNPRRSLIPCFAGHLAKNLGVFAVKLAQGHIAGWW